MGKITRRGTIAAAAATAAALAFAPAALANDEGYVIDEDALEDVQPDVGPGLYRLAKADRIGTSVHAAEAVDDVWGDTVIIANNQEYSDALAAGPLADILDAPVLIDRPGTSPSGQIRAYLADEDNGVENVILASGTSVFTNGYARAVEDIVDGDVERYAGNNRYQTAVALAAAAIDTGAFAGGDDTEAGVNVFLASGTDFPDALAAGAAAAAHSGVVLLTVGDDRIDSVTGLFLTAGQFGSTDYGENFATSVIAAGGPAASAAAEGWNGNPVDVDFAHVGADRYETALILAEGYNSGAEAAVIASGENFPDAIVGGALAGNVDGPLLLTKENSLTRSVWNYLEDNRTDFEDIIVLGGPDSISKTVSNQLAREVEWTY